MKKVYIIQDGDMEIIGATLSKEVAKEMIIDNADFDTIYDGYMSECENDEDDCYEMAQKEIEEFAEKLVNGQDEDLYIDDMQVWCTITDLSE